LTGVRVGVGVSGGIDGLLLPALSRNIPVIFFDKDNAKDAVVITVYA
jgi:hypothetical protein